MLQIVVACFIVAIATSWLIWELFVPAAVRARVLRRNSQSGGSSCADGCASCTGCAPEGEGARAQVIVWHKRTPDK